MISFIEEKYGKIDILVNNAGTARHNKIDKMPEEDWDAVIDINLKSTFLCIQAVVPLMKKQKDGRIINISSKAWTGGTGNINISGNANYAASKGGVFSLTRTLALELAPFNITVNCISPGLIETPLVKSASPEKRKQLTNSQLVSGIIGTPKDIAWGVLFFAAEESDYVTGQNIFICGGKSLFTGMDLLRNTDE